VTPARLRALTVPLERVAPVAFGADGIVFAGPTLALGGEGAALEIALPEGLSDPVALEAVHEQLRDIELEDHVGTRGTGPLALGAFPFERGGGATLRVPARIVGTDGEGHSWLTVIDASPTSAMVEEFTARVRHAAPTHTPGRQPVLVGIEPLPEGRAYAKAVAHALVALDAHELDKVVLARCIDACFDADLPIGDIVERLYRGEPHCTTFSIPTPDGRFIGASPELLVERTGTTVRCQPLAGTIGLDGAARDDELATARLLASAKDNDEHHFVVADIAERLAPLCDVVAIPDAPSIVRLATIAHLATTLEGTLTTRPDGTTPDALALLAALHPTPAVGGVPLARSLSLIEELEAAPRRQWAGPVGWTDARGDGQWVIGIRSATIRGASATLHAGAGIVRGSDPDAELAETTLKFAGVLEALSQGASSLLR